MKNKYYSLFAIFAMLSMALSMQAQSVIGKVMSADGPVIGANVVIVGTTEGASTDLDGNYEIQLSKSGTYNLQVTYVGFITQTQTVSVNSNESKELNFNLEEDALKLENIVVVGSRTSPRSNTSTPLPVDVIGTKDLIATGQPTFDKALQYRIPSFNTVQTPVNDATSLLDPYEIRNMGPSRTLILINGKRKNMSSLLYTQTSPGRGETGADISSIPTDAVKKIEILRDGASAQYGSDAIAGVMNIILKDDAQNGSVTLRTGITSEGDGEMAGVSINNGNKLGKNGFINYTIDFSKSALANRPGKVDAAGEAGDFGADISKVQSFLSKYPDAGNINGSPATTSAKFEANGGIDAGEKSQLYFNGAYVYKKVNSYANYRTPYWRTIESFPYLADFFAGGNASKYEGYVPTFDGDLTDYNATVGFKTEKNGWNADASFTTGYNKQTYTVRNSHNRNFVYDTRYLGDLNTNGTVDANELELVNKYRENSPIQFYAGGTAFDHIVGNIDISKRFSDKIAIAFGSEFRTENFTVIEGDLASYEGGGADSFAGNSKENSGKFNRYNIGGYIDLAFDPSDNFLINGTARIENYSDFGTKAVWKLSSRLKLNESATIRASLSTGFRAPSLHQIYTQKAQYSFVPGSGIQVGGLVNNVSPAARFLGIPSLKPETSTNFTVGAGLKPAPGLSITLDYYNIKVKDRIILSSQITRTEQASALNEILDANNYSDLSFFVNGIDTKTSGIDVVSNYKVGKLNVSLSGNITLKNERDGKLKNPSIIEAAGQSVSNQTQEALFFTSRPKTKWILGLGYDVSDKFNVSLNNTYFGKTTFRQEGMDLNLKTEFTPKIVSDLAINWSATDRLTIGANINNLLNVLPKWKFVALNAAGTSILSDAAATKNQSNLITFNQRYSQMTYDGYHFSQLGTTFSLSANYRF